MGPDGVLVSQDGGRSAGVPHRDPCLQVVSIARTASSCLSFSILSATTCAPRGEQPADPSAVWPRYGRRRGVRRASRKLHRTTHVPMFRSRRCVRHRNELHRWHGTKTRMGAAKQRLPVAHHPCREVDDGCTGSSNAVSRTARDSPSAIADTRLSGTNNDILRCRRYGPSCSGTDFFVRCGSDVRSQPPRSERTRPT